MKYIRVMFKVGGVALAALMATLVSVSSASAAVEFSPPVATVYFDAHKWNLTDEDHDVLQAALPAMVGASQIRVFGYVQKSSNPKVHEVPLSYKRAEAVADYISRELGKYLGSDQAMPEILAIRGGQPSIWANTPEARRANVYLTFPEPASEPVPSSEPSVEPVVVPTLEPTPLPTPIPSEAGSPSPTPTKTNNGGGNDKK